MNTRTEAAPGHLLRSWRERRRLSQLELSSQTGVSARHLSFVETGRSRPSRELIIRLTSHLDVPLRERNQLLLAAGLSPEYRGGQLGDPELAQVHAALEIILDSHGSTPSVVVDREWNVIDGNAAMAVLLDNVAPFLLEAPINSLRVAMHPEGMAPHIINLAQWRRSVIDRVRRQAESTGDPRVLDLLAELSSYPGGFSSDVSPHDDVAVPLVMNIRGQQLAFLTTIATFGTPMDVTVSELVIESFFPANVETRVALEGFAREGNEPLADALLRLTRSHAVEPRQSRQRLRDRSAD